MFRTARDERVTHHIPDEWAVAHNHRVQRQPHTLHFCIPPSLHRIPKPFSKCIQITLNLLLPFLRVFARVSRKERPKDPVRGIVAHYGIRSRLKEPRPEGRLGHHLRTSVEEYFSFFPRQRRWVGCGLAETRGSVHSDKGEIRERTVCILHLRGR